MYDKRRDPDELDNRVLRVDKELIRRYSELLAGLATCRGNSCRQLEDAPLSPKERERLRRPRKKRRKHAVKG